MSEDVPKRLPSSSNLVFEPSYENQPKKNNEEKSQLFQYKQKFDLSYAQYGIVKPMMGGSGFKDKILGGNTKSEFGSIDMTILNEKPMLNLLHVPNMHERNFLTRYLYYFFFTTSKRTDCVYPSKTETRHSVLSDERLRHAIVTTLEENKIIRPEGNSIDLKLKKKLVQKATSALNEMVASMSSTALKFCGWLFLTLLRQLTDAVHIHQGQLEVLKTILQDDKPTIYFPLHFSHFDYILLSLVMYHNEMRSPFVASGNNLLIQPFSAIMRRVGGFFIRRKIDEGNRKDLIYRAVLNSYVSKLLKDGQSMEIFIEGTRTRSGLPNLPKTGLLAVAVDAFRNGSVPDINLVPVCISYEKILEGTFRTELMGQPKKPETFISSIVSICKIFFGYYGHIRINFGVPQSLKKTLQEITLSPSCTFSNQFESSRLFQPDAVLSSTDKSLNPNTDLTNEIGGDQANDSQLINYELSEDEDQSRELVSYLGERIVYNSLKCKVFMSTNLVSFLLLHRWRHGLTLSQLVESFRQLTTELFTRSYDVGFAGDYRDVVLHALSLLGPELVQFDHRYTSNMKRCPSNASVRSRKSADSGYELDDTANLDKSPQSISTDIKQAHSGSDSGEEMFFSDHEDQDTGSYMTAVESMSALHNFFSQSSLKNRIPSQPKQNLSPQKSPNLDSNLFIEPVLKAPQVFDLSYYANALTPLFALESIVALAVGAITHYRFSTLEKKLQILSERSTIDCVQMDIEDFPESMTRSFLRSKLATKAIEVIELLQIDLFLCDVTQNLEEAVSEAIDRLVTRGCLTVEEYGNSAGTRKSNTAHELGFDEFQVDNDQWIKVDLEQIPSFIYIQSVISIFIEGYVAASSKLTCLLVRPLKEDELKKEMLAAAQRRINEGLALRNESCSSDIIRNAVRSFEWTGVLIRDQENKKELRLSEDYKSAESIARLVSQISQFLF